MPEEIKVMGYKAMRLYYYAMMKGEYVNNLIRCMFVGHWGVGKTTLVKGILEQDQTGITSTDGIEVYIKRCFFDKEKGTWHIQGIFNRKGVSRAMYLNYTIFKVNMF